MNTNLFDNSAVKNLLKKRLSDEKYMHSLGVANTAQRLAEIYGEDIEKAKTAGLLHDITKCLSDEEQIDLFKYYNIDCDPDIFKSRNLWHAVTAAYYVKNELKIDDGYILDSIRYHTTGRRGMTLLDKIIYVADLAEPNRKDYEAGDIRTVALINLDEAVFYEVKSCIEINIKRNNYIYKDTFEMYNEYALKLKEK